MTEKLLQYIWQFQLFNKSDLVTSDKNALQIIYQGKLNTNQGPDFLEAKIKINNTIWVGNIELHINTSGWDAHKHSDDKNYSNVVLHVVWEHDKPIENAGLNTFPTLELQSRVSKLLLNKYEEMMNASSFIPCEKQIYSVNELIFSNWKQRLLAERLEHKSKTIFDFLHQNNFNWEETLWWLIAKNFGIKVNSEAFEKVARSIQVSLLAKHKNQIHQLEALLFGQAGLLQKDFTEDYPAMLKKEYNFYKKKYKLESPQIQLFFLRMRPANFPTVRLAQLAMLVHKSTHLFSKIIDEDDLKKLKELLKVTANDYWHYHYLFDEQSSFKKKKLGDDMINNILINTIVPILFSYGLYHNEERYKDKALAWLLEVASEKNSITKGFGKIKIGSSNSYDSQSLIQLKNVYCDQKKCLQCAVGNALLKAES